MNTLKQKLVTLLFLTAGLFSFAQVGIGTQTPKAALDVVSTTQGFLMPRMSTTDRNAMTVGPDQLGMQVYDTDTNSIWTYNGGAWVLQQGSDNLGDHTATQDLDLGTNKLVGNGGTDGIAVAANGKVGIGTASPTGKLDVRGTTEITSPANFTSSLRLRNLAGKMTYNFTHVGANDAASFKMSDGLGELAANQKVQISANDVSYFNGGNVGIGTTTPSRKLHLKDGTLLTEGEGAWQEHMFTQASGNANGVNITLKKARGTLAAPTATQSGDILGEYKFSGHDGSGWINNTAMIVSRATENFSTTTQGTDIAFRTTANGTTTTFEKMVIKGDGNVGIGTTNPSEKLEVAGNINFTGDLYQNGTLYSAGRKFVDGTTATDAVYTAGNVGIGTANPTVALQVAGHIQNTGHIASGAGTGGVAMTVNDGYGNANLTFNHVEGKPEQVGKSARIEVDTDNTNSAVPAIMSFELGDAPTALVATPLNEVMILRGDGRVGIGTYPDASAALDVSSTTRGFLPPRMTTAQRDAIASPVAGLIIYNSTTDALNFFSGSTNAWESLGGAGGALGATANVSFINSFPSSNYIVNSPMEGEKIEVIINNTGLSNLDMSFATSDITLSGGPGVTVSAVSSASRTISPGQSYTVTYTLSGTPSFAGVLTANYSFNGLEESGVVTIDLQQLITQNGLTYLTVRSVVTGEVWLDRNLGASQAATSVSDAASYGDFYQWGRNSDGHQLSSSNVTAGPVAVGTEGADFITSSVEDWLTVRDDTRWIEGGKGSEDPCPAGFRVPTYTELHTERLSWSPGNASGAFSSVLKLPMAGNRGVDGSINNPGVYGGYWTSSPATNRAWMVRFRSYDVSMNNFQRPFGLSIRCIKN